MRYEQPSVAVARLHELLQYDPETGLLHWKVRRNQYAVVGAVAGHKANCRGKLYFRVRIDNALIMGHWIAWAMAYGAWPDDQIDHEDGDGLNNRLTNLKVKPQAENNRNAAIRRDNKTGVCGVVTTRSGNYVAHIRCDGRLKHLGTFKNLEDAAAARREAAASIGFHPNHGRERKP